MSAINHIKNPLTIIGIFAGIVEVSANFVLPFLEEGQQATYIWFLMLFPAALVVLFFITLNFNHVVLYAPSDYKDDQSFMRANGKMDNNVVVGTDPTQGFDLS
ncbi:hypothetical protein BZK40_12045 [Citrobacter portucalensis]|uniref:hypothetical protein n=1 Tax=Citrobacter freundii complex TaxID=1344959 RepID=UPI0009ADE172|nr:MULTISPECIES: hypothetical protein [Citrobacter freundii complex]MBJ8837940.1 hypothetical protein [Citrobacter freundii]OPW92489.1 hypothetical protein BZK40_12045 [Citrobacter portucalensis]